MATHLSDLGEDYAAGNNLPHDKTPGLSGWRHGVFVPDALILTRQVLGENSGRFPQRTLPPKERGFSCHHLCTCRRYLLKGRSERPFGRRMPFAWLVKTTTPALAGHETAPATTTNPIAINSRPLILTKTCVNENRLSGRQKGG